MNRRQFVIGTLGALPVLLAGAPALGKVFRVGFITITTPVAVSDPTNHLNSGYRPEMRDREYVEGLTEIDLRRCSSEPATARTSRTGG